MAELLVKVPDRVAEEFVGTVEWVREHLDDSFGVDLAVRTAMADWVSDVRLEFARLEATGTDDLECQADASDVFDLSLYASGTASVGDRS